MGFWDLSVGGSDVRYYPPPPLVLVDISRFGSYSSEFPPGRVGTMFAVELSALVFKRATHRGVSLASPIRQSKLGTPILHLRAQKPQAFPRRWSWGRIWGKQRTVLLQRRGMASGKPRIDAPGPKGCPPFSPSLGSTRKNMCGRGFNLISKLGRTGSSIAVSWPEHLVGWGSFPKNVALVGWDTECKSDPFCAISG